MKPDAQRTTGAAATGDAGHVVLWRRNSGESQDIPGVEHLVVRATSADGWIIGVDDAGSAFRLRYEIHWDEPTWCTRRLEIESVTAAGERRLSLTADGRGAWRGADGAELDQFRGCTDVDIWPSVFTNTLPIKRLQLAVGAHADIDVVYVEAPGLRTMRARQRYSRTAAAEYRFENIDSPFDVAFDVDPLGLVLDYPGVAERVVPR
jgi:hypothetical protein